MEDTRSGASRRPSELGGGGGTSHWNSVEVALAQICVQGLGCKEKLQWRLAEHPRTRQSCARQLCPSRPSSGSCAFCCGHDQILATWLRKLVLKMLEACLKYLAA